MALWGKSCACAGAVGAKTPANIAKAAIVVLLYKLCSLLMRARRVRTANRRNTVTAHASIARADVH
jgi:hypothetical protein